MKISYTILPIWLFFIGLTIFYNCKYAANMSGDIGRLGKIAFGSEYEIMMRQHYLKDTLYRKIEDNSILSEDTFSILITGDSFCRLGVSGFNNYLASMPFPHHVGNYQGKHYNPLQTGWDLLYNNIIDSIHVPILIIEVVEREFMKRIERLSFSDPNMAYPESQSSLTNTSPASEWSLLEAKNFLLLKLGYNRSICKLRLSQKMFEHKSADELYFYKEDINSEMNIPSTKSSIVKQKLERLFQESQKKGIKLLLLIAADKYDVYQPFIVNNPYPSKTINEDLENLMPSCPNIIYSKKIIQPYLYKGEKDMYLINDTHWSYKSGKIIAENILNYL